MQDSSDEQVSNTSFLFMDHPNVFFFLKKFIEERNGEVMSVFAMIR